MRELMTHFSGLPPDLDLKQCLAKPRDCIRYGHAGKAGLCPPGSRFLYSDINFMTLGFLVEKTRAVCR